MNASDITALIPAAGRVPEGLLALSNIACPAMIPVGGRPVIHWTVSYLRSLGVRKYVVAVSRPGMFVEEFLDCAFGQDCNFRFITPTRDLGVGGTLNELVERCETKSALVVLGDTHFHFSDTDALARDHAQPFVLTHPVEDSYRWCVAEATADGTLARLHDKVEGLPTPLEALIGVYYFPDTRLLAQASSDNVAAADATGKRAELAGILERVNRETPIAVRRADSWLDCGNADMQARAHQTLLQARAFNDVKIDPVLGTLTKRSRDSEKFINEINYLRLLPAELSILFPRVLGYSIDWNDPWIEMEYYGYPTLSDVFLFEAVDPAVWKRLFTHLSEILRVKLGRHRRPIAPRAVREMYVTKTRSRLETIRCSDELAGLLQYRGEVTINGVAVPNLPLLWPRIEADVEELVKTASGAVVHGDLCLSNILYDMRSRICKLIDPRGSFGEVGIYGDPRYDIAKLWHSVHGLYDFIVNDLFRVSLSGTQIELSIRATAAHRAIEDGFSSVFFASDYDRHEIQLISALLFASMPALHYDKPHRQLAMYARSLQLFAEYLTSPRA